MRLISLMFLLSASNAVWAEPLHCFGTAPNWAVELGQETARVQLRERVGTYQLRLTTPAKNDPETTAYTLIGDTDTAILIAHPGQCNTLSIQAHLLTQDRNEAILLSGCCRATNE